MITEGALARVARGAPGAHSPPAVAPPHAATRPARDGDRRQQRIIGGSLYGGRTLTAGDVLIPLNQNEVKAAAEKLVDRGAEVIGILFLNSFVNASHELQAKSIVEEVEFAQRTRTFG